MRSSRFACRSRTFYNSLTDEQQRRLRREASGSAESGANVSDGRAPNLRQAGNCRWDHGRDRTRSTIDRAAARGLGNVAAEISRHGTAYRQFLPPPIRSWVPWVGRRCNGSPRRYAVCGHDHEPGAATVLRFARRQAEDGSQPGAAPSQIFRPRRRATADLETLNAATRLRCKTPGDKFPARRRNKPRSLIDVASDRLPKSPVSLSPGNEVLCVLKTRFGNSGDEGRLGRAQIRCRPPAGWRDGSERLC